jgi:hypothetical protein
MNRYILFFLGLFSIVATLYVGAYYAMVDRFPTQVDHISTTVNERVIVNGREGLSMTVTSSFSCGPAPFPIYLFGGDVSEWFFAPMHELDKKLRPGAWK